MALDKEEQKPHSVSIDNRTRCSMTGIRKVISATDSAITMQSSCGLINVLGSNLKLTTFSESSETLSFMGEINCIKYGAKTSTIKKIFR